MMGPARPERVSLIAWRRRIQEEADRLSRTVEALRAGDSSPADRSRPYWEAIQEDIALARELAERSAKFPRRWIHELALQWTGAHAEAAQAALDRADEALLMVAPDDWVWATIRSTNAFNDNGTAPAHQDVQVTEQIKVADRQTLRALRHDENVARETARAQVLILRNVLSCATVLLLIILVTIGIWAAWNPGLLPLRPDAKGNLDGGSGDVFVVEVMGALGGLVSAIATVRSLSGYRRNWGLPLVQSLLKVPMGGAVALIGVFLVQQNFFLALKPVSWTQVPAYALVFGFAQLAVTRLVDSKARDLAGNLAANRRTTKLVAEASSHSTRV